MKEMLSEHFSREELQCPCCKRCEMDAGTLAMVERMRSILKRPLHPTSGFRCHKHNKDVGGKLNSLHLVGKAMDLKCYDTLTAYDFIAAAMQAGAGGIGIGPDKFHVDSRPIDVRRLWTY